MISDFKNTIIQFNIGLGLFSLIILNSTLSIAQDSHLSQFYASPLAVNPALTGMYDGTVRFNMHHRSQWGSLIRKPFVTDYVAYDIPKEKFGVGGYILNNRAGSAALNDFTFLLSGAYEITIDRARIQKLTTGLQLGVIQKSVNRNNLSFDNQYNKDIDGFDQTYVSNENFENTSIYLPDVNFGVYYKFDNPKKKIAPYISLAGYHLTRPKETFFGQSGRLPRKFVGYGGSTVRIDDYFSMDVNMLFMRRENNNTLNFGMLGYYHFEGSEYTVFIGPYYRNKDALIIHFGLQWSEYILRLSYDVNTSKLNALSRSKGGFELSFAYVREKKKYLPSISRKMVPQF